MDTVHRRRLHDLSGEEHRRAGLFRNGPVLHRQLLRLRLPALEEDPMNRLGFMDRQGTTTGH